MAPGSTIFLKTARPHRIPMADARVCTVLLTRVYVLRVLPDIDRADGFAQAHGCATESHFGLAFASACSKPSKRYHHDIRCGVTPEVSNDPAAAALRRASERDRC